jgi:hypothetical protein
MTEAELYESTRELCRWLRVLVYHAYNSRRSEPSWPDLVLVGASGLLFRELKAGRGRLTRDQAMWLDRLDAAGADADVWRPIDWPDRIHAEIARITTTHRKETRP